MILDEYVIEKSDCSVKCGRGKRVVTKIQCPKVNGTDFNCKSEVERIEEDCQAPDCSDAEFGIWSEWTFCSKSCIKNLSDKSFKKRTRTCEGENCNVGTIETQECSVPFCPPECPKYELVSLKTDDQDHSQIMAEISINKAKLSFSELINQDFKLMSLDEIDDSNLISLSWTADQFFGEISNTGLIRSLRRNATYRPLITVKSQILVNGTRSKLFLNDSKLTLECFGAEFSCNYWSCNDTSKIPSLRVCNGKADCPDRSDEFSELCNGDHEFVTLIIK